MIVQVKLFIFIRQHPHRRLPGLSRRLHVACLRAFIQLQFGLEYHDTSWGFVGYLSYRSIQCFSQHIG